ncbi:MAG: hypothetical protein RJA22_2504 [Verrucomicrobiota bacterium]|jgi:TatD DNase family protein
MRLFDAHNHLQDERLAPHWPGLLEACAAEGVVRQVVNGAAESDWPQVLELARRHPQVLPSFGYHPWHVHERTADWQRHLVHFLDQVPSAVGEIGLDRWKEGLDLVAQEEVFVWQWRLAAERQVPASIHCLQAWGRMLEILQREPRPSCGFLLHSYGGPAEMIRPLARLGAYFSFPGYFLHERKARQRETFRQVPWERLLVETDAPDQLPPASRMPHALAGPGGVALNHPANLRAIHEGLAAVRGEAPAVLARQLEENFHRLFAPVLARMPAL